MSAETWHGIGVLCFIVLIFLVCREIICWYWKQNEHTALLKDIRFYLEEILYILDSSGKVERIEEKSFVAKFMENLKK